LLQMCFIRSLLARVWNITNILERTVTCRICNSALWSITHVCIVCCLWQIFGEDGQDDSQVDSELRTLHLANSTLHMSTGSESRRQ
jgi:hypothetical protein